MFGTKIDKPIAFDEILVLSSYMCKGSKVHYYKQFICVSYSTTCTENNQCYLQMC